MFNKHNLKKNQGMLVGNFRKKGYDWWWHSFTGYDVETGEEKPFFIEFYLCNPDHAKAQPSFGDHPSYLMVKAGCWGEDAMQLHRFFPWTQVLLNRGADFSVVAKDCFLSERRSFGSISVSSTDARIHPEWMSDSGSISWDLDFEKLIAFNVGYGTSALLRKLQAFEMYWHAEGMKTEYSGTVTCNGKTYLVKPKTSFGYADKNWGSNFTSPWVWLSSNDLTSRITGHKLRNSVFDIGGGCPKVFGISIPRKLLGAMYYQGEEMEFNFSKFWKPSKTKFACKETESEIQWQVMQRNSRYMMKTQVRCKKKDMLLVKYQAPNGTRKHNRLWNGGNGTGLIRLYENQNGTWKLIDEILAKHVGCEFGEYGE